MALAKDLSGNSPVGQKIETEIITKTVREILTPLTITSGAAQVSQSTLLAGERNQDSASNSYLVVRDECNATVVDVADNDTQVSASPGHLLGVYINTTLSAHALPIKDGGVAGTAVFTIPASAAAGTFYDFKGARFVIDIHVDPNDAATGNITVLWRPI